MLVEISAQASNMWRRQCRSFCCLHSTCRQSSDQDPSKASHEIHVVGDIHPSICISHTATHSFCLLFSPLPLHSFTAAFLFDSMLLACWSLRLLAIHFRSCKQNFHLALLPSQILVDRYIILISRPERHLSQRLPISQIELLFTRV